LIEELPQSLRRLGTAVEELVAAYKLWSQDELLKGG
jgi:hypothetical protein